MGAPDNLGRLAEAGIRLTPVGDRLLTDELRTLIRAHRAELIELITLMRAYADHNAFTQADFDEAMTVALRNVEGWLIYLRTQPECKTVQ
jgi:hypothetical protein